MKLLIPMTCYDLLDLDLHDRSVVLFGSGKYIFSRKKDNYIVNLYEIFWFHMEVWYLEGKITRIIAIDEQIIEREYTTTFLMENLPV